MERLTERFDNGQVAVMGCGENCKYNYKYCRNHYEDCPEINRLYERLAAYEDTGLTPDQIRELAERDTAKAPEEIQDAYGDTRLICPNCRNSVINYFNRSRPPQFCMICGQRLKQEE